VARPDRRGPFAVRPRRHLLLDLLRDAALRHLSSGDEERAWVFTWLEGQDSEVFVRLRVWLLARVASEGARKEAVLAEPEVLFSRSSLPEIHDLLPVAFAGMDEAGRAALVTRIESGPDPEPWMEGDAASPAEIEAWQDEWRQRLLAALEPELADAARSRLEQLRRDRGRLERPGSGEGEVTGWVGPTSPVGAVDLAQMDHDELLGLLREFRAERHFAAPSPAGLARELTSAIESAPGDWSWFAGELPGIPATYVGAWFTALRKVVARDETIGDIASVLTSIGWVLDREGDPDGQGDFLDPDVDFYRSQQAAADLLIELLERDRPELDLRGEVWELVEKLADSTDPTPEREASLEPGPMQLSLTCLRPRGATALLRYLQWLEVRLPDGEGPGPRGMAAAPEADPTLARLLDEDPSIGVRAALASEARLLAMVDLDLLERRIAAFTDPDGDLRARAGWEAYVDYGEVYAPLVALLADAYRRDVELLAGAGPKPDEHRRRLARAVAVIWRDIPDSAPDLPGQFLLHGQDADRAQMVGLLGRALRPDPSGAYRPSPDDITRHRELWAGRLAEDPGPQAGGGRAGASSRSVTSSVWPLPWSGPPAISGISGGGLACWRPLSPRTRGSPPRRSGCSRYLSEAARRLHRT
jgi:hypothetical protein